MKFKVMEYGKEMRTELLCKDKYKNYNYYVLNLGTHPTAYIEIPKENKLYRKSYDEIYKIGCDIDVHGGLTYSDNELMGVKSENWFIGWDYAHCGDYCGYEEHMPESIRTYGKKWTTEEIIEECKNAIDQIIDFESKEIIEEPKKIEKLDVALLGQCDNWLRCPTNKVTKQDVELNPYIIDNIRENTLYFQRKINELIDVINELKRDK